MLKLSLSVVCFICLSSLLYAEQEKSSIEKLDSRKIITIFKGKDYKKKLEAYKLLNEKLEDGTLQKSNLEELNKLFEFCSISVKKIPWDKYFQLSPEEAKNLSKTERNKINSAGLMVEILVIGKMLNNPNAEKFASYLEEKRKTSLVEENLYKAWCRSLSWQNSKKAKKLLTSGYANCRKKLMDIMKHREYSKNQLSLSFLIGISNNSKMLSELKKDRQATEKLLSSIKQQFPTLTGDSLKDRTVRKAFVNLYYHLAPPSDAMSWLEEVLESPYMSVREKQLIRQNKINDLKRSLNIAIDKEK